MFVLFFRVYLLKRNIAVRLINHLEWKDLELKMILVDKNRGISFHCLAGDFS
jgi:hypothetical protein